MPPPSADHGQSDGALAAGGTTGVCEASLPQEIAEAVRRFEIAAFGAGPSGLAHRSPEGVPSVRSAILRAEGLADATSQRLAVGGWASRWLQAARSGGVWPRCPRRSWRLFTL